MPRPGTGLPAPRGPAGRVGDLGMQGGPPSPRLLPGPLAGAPWRRACRLAGGFGVEDVVTVEMQNFPACSQL
jgi:hypothetical protein